jgi:hypothetical protein
MAARVFNRSRVEHTSSSSRVTISASPGPDRPAAAPVVCAVRFPERCAGNRPSLWF